MGGGKRKILRNLQESKRKKNTSSMGKMARFCVLGVPGAPFCHCASQNVQEWGERSKKRPRKVLHILFRWQKVVREVKFEFFFQRKKLLVFLISFAVSLESKQKY